MRIKEGLGPKGQKVEGTLGEGVVEVAISRASGGKVEVVVFWLLSSSQGCLEVVASKEDPINFSWRASNSL